MRESKTQGKRNESSKQMAGMAAVPGNVHQCGSVRERKKRVGENNPGHQNAAGKSLLNWLSSQGKMLSGR
jgi:hypothetical protein